MKKLRKIRKKKLLKLISFTLLCSLFLTSIRHQLTRVDALDVTSIPSEIKPCLPVTGKNILSVSLISGFDYHDKTYFLVYIKEKVYVFADSPDVMDRDTIVLHDKNGCLVVVPREGYYKKSLEGFMPQQVARFIALKRLQEFIRKDGSKEAFIAKLHEPMDGDDIEASNKYYFFPEQLWAYKQEKIPLPSKYKIIQSVEEIDGYKEFNPVYQ